MLSKILRWARITKSSPDTQQFPSQQMSYLGKVADGVMLFPYGFHGNVPADVLALMATVQGSAENRVALGVLPKDRPTLAEGEIAFYHPTTGGFMIWRANGDCQIKPTGKLLIVADTEFTGTVTANGKVIDDTHSHPAGTPPGNTGTVN